MRQKLKLVIRKPSPTRPHAGFSLIEILIAILLLSLMMLGIYAVVDNGVRTRDNLLLEDRDFVDAQRAIERMELDLSQFYSPLFYTIRAKDAYRQRQMQQEMSGENTTSSDSTMEKMPESNFIPSEYFPEVAVNGIPIPAIIGEDKSSLVIFTNSNRRKIADNKESHYSWIQYQLQSSAPEADDKTNPDAPMEIVRKEVVFDPYGRNIDWDNIRPQVLLKNVKSMEFSFYDLTKKKYVSSTLSLSDPLLPAAINVKIVRLDATNIEETINKTFRPLWPKFDTKKGQGPKKTLPTENLEEGGDGQ